MKNLLSALFAAACLIGASGVGGSAPSMVSLQILLEENLNGSHEAKQSKRAEHSQP